MIDAYSLWIIRSAEKLKMKVEHLKWISLFLPETEDIHVSVSIGNRIYKGRGYSNTPDSALKKAISESVERVVGLEFAESTNGIASHVTLDLAKENARNELVERDLFLSHFRTNTPFAFSSEMTRLIPESIRSFVFDAGDSISIYSMKCNNLGKGFVCLVSGESLWGGIIGLSFGSENDEQLIIKASLEAFRLYWHRRANKSLNPGLHIDAFLKQNSWTFIDNGTLCLNRAYFDKIRHLFPRKELVDLRGFIQYSLTEFSFENLSEKYTNIENCPLFVVRCTSPYSQKLNAGPFTMESISYEGLKRFKNNEEYKLNKLPHPVN